MADNNTVTIVTHSSRFHNDDIFAVSTLLLLLEGENVEVVRSRDMNVIEKGDYVVDVGQIYDPKKNKFDHHQAGGAGKRENGIPYASFGLVWKEYGEKLCGSKEVAQRIDKVYVQQIDSSDNGMQIMQSKMKGFYPFDVSLIVNTLSPTWKEETNIDDVFMEIVSYIKTFLSRAIKVEKDRHEGALKVIELYKNSKDKRLIELEERYPWEETLSSFPEPLYVVYRNRDNNWTIKCVAEDFFLMTNRKYLPKSWAGKSGQELESITGVLGSIFCHNQCFMAVAKTKEAILKLAEIALKS